MVLNITEMIKNNKISKTLNIQKYLKKQNKKYNNRIILYFSENTLIEIYKKNIKKIIFPKIKNLKIELEIDIINFINQTINIDLLLEFLKFKIIHTCKNYEEYSIYFNSKYKYEISNLLENFIPRRKGLFSQKVMLKKFTLVFHKFQNYVLDLTSLYITEYLHLEGFKTVKGIPKISPDVIYLENIIKIEEDFIKNKKNIKKFFINICEHNGGKNKCEKILYNKNFLNDIIKKTICEFSFANYDKINNNNSNFVFDNCNIENIKNVYLYSPDTNNNTIFLKNSIKTHIDLFKSNVKYLNLSNIKELNLLLYDNKLNGIIFNVKKLDIVVDEKNKKIDHILENLKLENVNNLTMYIGIELQENLENLLNLFLFLKNFIDKIDVKKCINVNITKRSKFKNQELVKVVGEIENSSLKNIKKEEYNQIFENLFQIFIEKFDTFVNLGLNFRNKKLKFLLKECKNDKIIKDFHNRINKLDTLISQI